MKRAVMLIVFAALAGCYSHDPFPSDSDITDSDFSWADATGTIVDVFGSPGGPLLYRDASGLFWNIDSNTIAVAPVETITGPSFASADCTGARYVFSPPAPRVTFLIGSEMGQAGGPTIHVRDDGATEAPVFVCSVVQASGACFAQKPCAQSAGLLLQDATPSPSLMVPALAFVPPLHPVVR